MGFEVILFESSASPPLLSPTLFRKAEVPALACIGEVHQRVTGKGVALILGGNTVPVLEDLIGVGAGSLICPAEVDGEAFFEKMRSHPEIAVRVNMRPGVFASSIEDARQKPQEPWPWPHENRMSALVPGFSRMMRSLTSSSESNPSLRNNTDETIRYGYRPETGKA